MLSGGSAASPASCAFPVPSFIPSVGVVVDGSVVFFLDVSDVFGLGSFERDMVMVTAMRNITH
jgi:hypothetical protein